MLKKDAKYHYGIKKHTCGTSYSEDCWMLGDDYLPILFIYKASANYMCEKFQKANKHAKYYVARYD